MIPSFDSEGNLPPGLHQATWAEFRERFWLFGHSEQRLRLGRQIERLLEEARASQIVERIVFGGSFVTDQAEPHDFDCIIVLKADTRYDNLTPSQRWVADTREASRRYRGDIFVAREDQPTLPVYLDFFAHNRRGKLVGLVEVTW